MRGGSIIRRGAPTGKQGWGAVVGGEGQSGLAAPQRGLFRPCFWTAVPGVQASLSPFLPTMPPWREQVACEEKRV